MSDDIQKVGSKTPSILNNTQFEKQNIGVYDYKNNIFPFKGLSLSDKKPTPTQEEKLHEQWSNINKNLSQDFFNQIEGISKRLNCKPEDLLGLMYGESRFDPAANGDNGKYRGLIQMTGSSLKKSIAYAKKENIKLNNNMKMEDFVKLPREEQLPYCEAYLAMVIEDTGLKGKELSGGQLWGLIKNPTHIKNSKFVNKIQHELDSIKALPKKYEVPEYLKRPQD